MSDSKETKPEAEKKPEAAASRYDAWKKENADLIKQSGVPKKKG